jgi:hypothetical protein
VSPGPPRPARHPNQPGPVRLVPHLTAALRGQFTKNLGMHGFLLKPPGNLVWFPHLQDSP